MQRPDASDALDVSLLSNTNINSNSSEICDLLQDNGLSIINEVDDLSLWKNLDVALSLPRLDASPTGRDILAMLSNSPDNETLIKQGTDGMSTTATTTPTTARSSARSSFVDHSDGLYVNHLSPRHLDSNEHSTGNPHKSDSLSQRFLSAWNFKRDPLFNQFSGRDLLSNDLPSERHARILTHSEAVSIVNPTDGLRRYSLPFLLRYRYSAPANRLDVITPMQLIDRVVDDSTNPLSPIRVSQHQQLPVHRANSTWSVADDGLTDWRTPTDESHHQQQVSSSPHRHDLIPFFKNSSADIDQSGHRSNFHSLHSTERLVSHRSGEADFILGRSVRNGFDMSGAPNLRHADSSHLPLLSSSSFGSLDDSFHRSNSASHNINNGTYTPRDIISRIYSNDSPPGSPTLDHCNSSFNARTFERLDNNEKLFPRHSAAFTHSNLGISHCDSLTSSRRRILPFGHPNFLSFLKSLPQNEFVHLARSVARYRRTSRLDSTPSTIVSINLCSCCTPHSAPVSGINYQTDFWLHQLPNGSVLHGVLDTNLSVMLVELHPELEVVEFLDRRLPAVIRQQVGNRLDRNFVVQVFGVSFMRSHLSGVWTIGDLPECTAADMRRLCSHPLYHHMLYDISNRQEIPVFRNLNLCPIQYSNSRPLPVSVSTTLRQPFNTSPCPPSTKSLTVLSTTPSTVCSSSDLVSPSKVKSLSIDNTLNKIAATAES